MIETAGKWTLATLLFVTIILLDTVVLFILWRWFMVPFGLPQIGFAWALGLGCVAGILAPTPPPPNDEDALRHGLSLMTKPFIILFAGFVAKQFM